MIGARMVRIFQIQVRGLQSGSLRFHFALHGSDLSLRGETRLIDVGLAGAHGGLAGTQRGNGGIQFLLGGGFFLDQRCQTVESCWSLTRFACAAARFASACNSATCLRAKSRSASLCARFPLACATAAS